MIRLLITGGREYSDKEKIREEILALGGKSAIEVIIHGHNPRGADHLADELAIEMGIPYKRFPADWIKHSRAAGPIRNQQMLDEGFPTYVLAFPDPNSSGTWDMVRRAKAADIPCKVIPAKKQTS